MPVAPFTGRLPFIRHSPDELQPIRPPRRQDSHRTGRLATHSAIGYRVFLQHPGKPYATKNGPFVRSYGADGEEIAPSPQYQLAMECRISQPNDLSRSRVSLEQDATLVAVIEQGGLHTGRNRESRDLDNHELPKNQADLSSENPFRGHSDPEPWAAL